MQRARVKGCSGADAGGVCVCAGLTVLPRLVGDICSIVGVYERLLGGARGRPKKARGPLGDRERAAGMEG